MLKEKTLQQLVLFGGTLTGTRGGCCYCPLTPQASYPLLLVRKASLKGAGTNEAVTPVYISTSTQNTMPQIDQDKLTGRFLATPGPY